MQNALGYKLNLKKNSNGKQSFGVIQKRFDKSDTLPPGPGQYMKAEIEVGAKHKPGEKSLRVGEGPQHTVVASCCNKEGKAQVLASYKSTTERKLDIVIGKNNPGVGQFNILDHMSIGVQKIQGGAPNNFLILSKNIDPCIRKVETMPSPRLLPPEMRSK